MSFRVGIHREVTKESFIDRVFVDHRMETARLQQIVSLFFFFFISIIIIIFSIPQRAAYPRLADVQSHFHAFVVVVSQSPLAKQVVFILRLKSQSFHFLIFSLLVIKGLMYVAKKIYAKTTVCLSHVAQLP